MLYGETAMSETNKKPNHLIEEKSPYLIQHVYNPVDWYPWGEKAIEKAKKEDKPILVSIGYSTCHWCHVMEEESFSDRSIAEIMNKYFICIKVDREQRPDLDKIYITAVSAMTGSAGWPLNVFLEPDSLKPFFGGTYFPSKPGAGVTTWPVILKKIAEAWNDSEKRKSLLSSADKITVFLENQLSGNSESNLIEKNNYEKLLLSAYKVFVNSYDKKMGGFGNAPKFPSPSNLDFLMFYSMPDKKGKALDMAFHTLLAMAKGGLYDQVGGGFHRYSTDERWHVPHFEKMLYDNAQLITSYILAYKISNKKKYLKTAEETINYLLRDMKHPQGAFYSAEDADSISDGKKKEGAFYVWAQSNISHILGEKESKIFSFRYGIKKDGNVLSDPYNEFKNQNILYIANSIKKTAEEFNTTEKEIEKSLIKSKEKLLEKRDNRSRPHLDDKIITSWNGLVISALSKAYQATENKKYYDAAKDAVNFIRQNLYQADKQNLYRIWRDGEKNIPALANDYAFLISGLIDLYKAGFNAGWLAWAIKLQEKQIELFYNIKNGGFYMTRKNHDKNLLIRVKEDSDSVIPSASSVSALNLIYLYRYTGRRDFYNAAEKTVKFGISGMAKHPASSPVMLKAARELDKKEIQIIIAGNKKEKETVRLLETAQLWTAFGKAVMLTGSSRNQEILASILPYVANVKKTDGRPTAYVCFENTCRPPVTDPAELEKLLKGKG